MLTPEQTAEFILDLNEVMTRHFDKTGAPPQAIAMALAGAFATTFTNMRPEVKKQCGECFVAALEKTQG